MIALLDHGCCGGPRLTGALPYGELDAANVATCAIRRIWSGRAVDTPGCGARVAVCHGCGLRTRVNGAQCPACGGMERPEVAHVHNGVVVASEQAREATAERVGSASGATDVPRASDTGPRRQEKAPSPRKPRQTRAAVKSSPEPTAPDLPLFK